MKKKIWIALLAVLMLIGMVASMSTVLAAETSDPENTENTAAPEQSYLSTLLAQNTFRGIFDAISADTDAALAMTAEDVLALEAHIATLPTPETEDETAARTEVLDMVAVLKENVSAVECTCGTETEAHDPACPKFVPAEEAAVYAGSDIKVGNTTLLTNTYYESGTLKKLNAKPESGGYIYVSSSRLEMKDFSYSANVGNNQAVLYCSNAISNLEIYLIGENKISGSSSTSKTTVYGMNLESATTKITAVEGGSLKVEMTNSTKPNYSYAIRAKKFTLESGTVDVSGGDARNTSSGILINTAGGFVNVTGGCLIATGGAVTENDSIGINAQTGTVSITGGTVKPSGGTGRYTDGIWALSHITIKNATVIANTGIATELSRGLCSSEGNITIENAHVEAIANQATNSHGIYGAGIGSAITISGQSYVRATGGQVGAEQPSYGICTNGTKINIQGDPSGDNDPLVIADGISGGINKDVTANDAIIFDYKTITENGERKYGQVYGNASLNDELKLENDMVLRVPEDATLNVQTGQIIGDGILDVDGDLIENNEMIIDDGVLVKDLDLNDTDDTRVIVNVYYTLPNGQKSDEPQNAVVLTKNMFNQEEGSHEYYLPHGTYGWYYVHGELNIDHRFYIQDGKGTEDPQTKIILGNDCTFNAKHGISVHATADEISSGIYVNALAIYREHPVEGTKTGKLIATGTGNAEGDLYKTAGIGGGNWAGDTGHSGAIYIYGGDITVSGATDAANIGSGAGGTAGPIVIKNAKVTSGDAGAAASIGAGNGGSVTTIEIANSLVLATSDQDHNGIGDDMDKSGTLTVKDSIIFTDKIGPENTTYENSLLFLNEKASEDQQGTYGHYNGTLVGALGDDGKVDAENKGVVTIILPLTIPSTATLTIQEGQTLIFDQGVYTHTNIVFENNGKIYRDWKSNFDISGFDENDKIGTQVYEIVNMVEGLDDSNINGNGVEIFKDIHPEGKVYALPQTTVAVNAPSGTHLQMDVETDDNTSVAVNKTYPFTVMSFEMPEDPVELTGELIRLIFSALAEKGELYDGFEGGNTQISILQERYFTVQYTFENRYSDVSFVPDRALPVGTKLILVDVFADNTWKIYRLELETETAVFASTLFKAIDGSDSVPASNAAQKILCVDLSAVDAAGSYAFTLLDNRSGTENDTDAITVSLCAGAVTLSEAQGGVNTITANATVSFGLESTPNSLVVELLDKNGNALNYPAGASVTIGGTTAKLHDNRAMASITNESIYAISITGLPAGEYLLRVSLAEDAAQLYPMQEITVDATSAAVTVTDGKVVIKAEGSTRLLPSTGGTIVFEVEALNAKTVHVVYQLKEGNGFDAYKIPTSGAESVTLTKNELEQMLGEISVTIPANDTDSAQTYRVWFYCGEAAAPTAVFPYNIIVSKAE